VAIEIEDFRLDDKLRQTRFFLRLAQRHACEISIAVGVPAQLQPAIEFAVMREQHPLAGSIDEPGRSGEMTRHATSLEAIGVLQAELAEHPSSGCCGSAGCAEAIEQLQ
jgi:hypothetical protein